MRSNSTWCCCRCSLSTRAATASAPAAVSTTPRFRFCATANKSQSRCWSASATLSSRSNRCLRRAGTWHWITSPRNEGLSIAERSTHEPLADENRTGHVFDRRSEARQGPTVERGAQLPGAQPHPRNAERRRGDDLSLELRGPWRSRHWRGGERALPRSDAVRSQKRLLRRRQRPRRSALVAGGRALQAQAETRDHAGRNQGAARLGRFRADAPRLSVLPVTEAQWQAILDQE